MAVEEITPICKVCKTTDPIRFYRHKKSGRWHKLCRICDSERISNLYNKRKQKLVDYKGGRCQKCGYDKCLQALDFHHRDPNKKDTYSLTKHKITDQILHELDECDLLCRNCHAEAHQLEMEEWRAMRLVMDCPPPRAISEKHRRTKQRSSL